MWSYSYEDTNLVVFPVNLVWYCEKMYEWEDDNRLDEALTVFKDVAKHGLLKLASIIIVFTNANNFISSLERIPLTKNKLFDSASSAVSYTGKNYKHAIECIKRLFVQVAQQVAAQTISYFVVDGLDCKKCAEFWNHVIKKTVMQEKHSQQANEINYEYFTQTVTPIIHVPFSSPSQKGKMIAADVIIETLQQ